MKQYGDIRDSFWYQFFADQGETLAFMAAIALFIVAYISNQKAKRATQDKKTQLRFIGIYWTSRRVRQDYAVVHQLGKTIGSAAFKDFLSPRGQPDAEWKALGSSTAAVQCHLAIHNTMLGYQETNYESLIEKIIFEFSLLERFEQVRTLRYLGRYSALQDRVSLLSPNDDDERIKHVLNPHDYAERTYEVYARMIEAIYLGYCLFRLFLIRRTMQQNMLYSMVELREIIDFVAAICVLPHEVGIKLVDISVDERAFDWVVRHRLENYGEWIDGEKRDKPFEWDGFDTDEERQEAYRQLAAKDAAQTA